LIKRMARPHYITALLLACFLLCSAAPAALAHLPRMVMDEQLVKIQEPEVSQAFYARLEGSPDIYEIHEEDDFLLYVNLLVPDLPEIRTDIQARVARVKEDSSEMILADLDGRVHHWEEFNEPFAGDRYLMGPEFSGKVPAGFYRIEVFSLQNRGKYVLSVGKQEVFTPAEMIHTFRTLPVLKRDFFEKSSLTAFFNLIGLFILISVAVLGLAIFLASWGINKLRRRL
jgi:hypothetical protein